MIYVTEIVLKEIDRNSVEFCPDGTFTAIARGLDFAAIPEQIFAKKEIIYGDMFTLPDGRRLIIGLSRQVRDVLGIPLKAWLNMRKENEKYLDEAIKYRTKISKYQRLFAHLSFWGRLKLLWTGFKNETIK